MIIDDTQATGVATELVRELRDALAGDVLAPGDPGYDDARRVWNGIIDRHPAAIARCECRRRPGGRPHRGRHRPPAVTVRGGGHQVAGTAVCDDGLVIDLSFMTDVTVDPVARTARVQGGAR